MAEVTTARSRPTNLSTPARSGGCLCGVTPLESALRGDWGVRRRLRSPSEVPPQGGWSPPFHLLAGPAAHWEGALGHTRVFTTGGWTGEVSVGRAVVNRLGSLTVPSPCRTRPSLLAARPPKSLTKHAGEGAACPQPRRRPKKKGIVSASASDWAGRSSGLRGWGSHGCHYGGWSEQRPLILGGRPRPKVRQPAPPSKH